MSIKLRILLALFSICSVSYGFCNKIEIPPSTLRSGDTPVVDDVSMNLSTINMTHFGQNWIAIASFSVPMNNSINPSLTFSNPSLNNMMQFVSGVWLNATDFQWTFTIQNSIVSLGLSTFVLDLGVSLDGNTQDPISISNLLTVDTQSPAVQTVQNNATLINTQTQSFCTTISFSEPMGTAMPSFTFLSSLFNANTAISFNANNSNWLSSQLLNACFDVNPSVYSGSGWIGLNLNSALDAQGNPLTTYNTPSWINWNTNQPTISAVPSLTLLTTQNIGENALQFTLQSNTSMNTALMPTLQFTSTSGAVSQLQQNMISSAWINNTTCILSYDLNTTPLNYTNVSVSVQNFVDLNGNPGIVTLFPNSFFLDTKRPTPYSSNSPFDFVNDDAVVDDDFFVDLNFTEPMMHGQNNFPTVEIRNSSNLPMPGVVYDQASSYWQNQATFRAFFQLQDLNLFESPISLFIENARDLQNNEMIPQTLNLDLFIDTKNPSIVSIEFSEDQLNINTNSVIITTTFNEIMNQLHAPVFETTGAFGQPNMIVYNTGQGFWMNNYTFQGTYTVNAFDYQGLVSLKPLNARDAQNNLVKDSIMIDVLSVDFVSLGTTDFDQFAFTLYPNPVAKDGIVKINENSVHIAEISSLEVFDNSGKSCKVKYDIVAGEVIINLAGLAEGVYQIVLQGKAGKQKLSLIIKN